MAFLLFLAGLCVGALASGILWAFRKGNFDTRMALLEKELSAANLATAEVSRQKNELEAKLGEREAALAESNGELSDWKNRASVLSAKLESEKESRQAERQSLEETQKALKLEFKELAGKILEEKSQKFSETNRQSLGDILKPLSENLDAFRKAVKESREKGIAEHASLKTEIGNLVRQTQSVSREAANLAKALKGDSKVQGDWGEMILSSILERSGLQKGVEYFVQETVRAEDGKNRRLDVLVKLPENRCIVIDSKVSLTAYERYLSTEESAVQKASLKEHIASVKKHIDELSAKKYDETQRGSLDFVVLFIPVETAYLLAMQESPDLWNYAYQKHVLMVSPTNLIACIKLIANLWQREERSRNAEKIARQGAKLYEKFVGFLSTFEKIGDGIRNAETAYEKAFGQLKQGRGNLTSQAESLRELGVKSNKALPKAFEDAETE